MSHDYPYTLGFIGCGNMAQAIAKGAIKSKLIEPTHIIGSNPGKANRNTFTTMGCHTTSNNADVLRQCKTVVIAVKPQKLADIATDLQQHATEDQHFVSVLAGKTTTSLEATISTSFHAKVIRVMPNTPLAISQGCCGVCLGQHATEQDAALIVEVLNASGKAFLVPESQMDALCALSGSGPAYLFYLAEALAEAATQLGLEKSEATAMAQQTLLGASTLLSQSNESAHALRQKVTSPNGTTQAATDVFDACQLKNIVSKALEANVKRSQELSK